MKSTQHRNLAGRNPFKFMHKPDFNTFFDYNKRGVLYAIPRTTAIPSFNEGVMSPELPMVGYAVNVDYSQLTVSFPLGGKVDFGMNFEILV